MASAILQEDAKFPNIDKYDSTDKKLDAVMDYLFLLREQLRYALNNLDEGNFNQTGLANITGPLYLKLSETDGRISELSFDIDGIRARVTNAEGAISTIDQKADSIALRVTSTEEDIDSLDGRVTTNTASIVVNANAITAEVTRATTNEGIISGSIETVAGRVSIVVDNNNAVKASVIVDAINDAESTVKIDADRIQMTGTTVFLTKSSADGYYDSLGSATSAANGVKNGLQTLGYTVINGGNITTGTIDATLVNVDGAFTVKNGTATKGYIGLGHGYDGVSTTEGIVMVGGQSADPTALTDQNNYVIVTNAGIRLQVYGNGNEYSFYLTPNGMFTKKNNEAAIPVNTAVFSA